MYPEYGTQEGRLSGTGCASDTDQEVEVSVLNGNRLYSLLEIIEQGVVDENARTNGFKKLLYSFHADRILVCRFFTISPVSECLTDLLGISLCLFDSCLLCQNSLSVVFAREIFPSKSGRVTDRSFLDGGKHWGLGALELWGLLDVLLVVLFLGSTVHLHVCGIM